MQEHRVTFPELALLAVTRGIAGFGAGLIISNRLTSDRRRAVGWPLLVAGVLSTMPIAIRLLRKRRNNDEAMPFIREQPPTDAALEMLG